MNKKIFLFVIILAQGLRVFCQGYLPLEKRAFSIDSISSFSLLMPGESVAHLNQAGKGILVIALLSPECPICKNYSTKLVAIKNKYLQEADFVGLIPGSFEEDDVKDFQKNYMPSWRLLRDTSMQLTHYLGGRATPEVLVIDNKDGVLVYKGAIDDWMVSLGKTRSHVSNYYLDVALHNFINNKPSIPFTKPIGCIINDF